VLNEERIENLVQTIRTVKADTKALELQTEFFDRVQRLGSADRSRK